MTWLAACSEPAAEQSPPPETENSSTWPGDPVTSLEDFEGFWLVQSFGDFEPGWQNGAPWRRAYVQVGRDDLSYSTGCNHSGNTASLGADATLRDTGDGSRLQTLMGCPPDWEDRDGRFFGFFDTNPEVTRPGDDWIILKSAVGELVLVRPEAWRLANAPELSEVTGRWIAVSAKNYDGWGHSGFGIGENAGVVTIAPRRIVWSQCSETPVAIRWTEDARLSRIDGDPGNCKAVERASDKGAWEVMRMLAASPAVVRTGPHSMVLIDGTGEKGRELHLQTEGSVLNPPELPPAPPAQPRPPPPPSPPPIRQ